MSVNLFPSRTKGRVSNCTTQVQETDATILNGDLTVVVDILATVAGASHCCTVVGICVNTCTDTSKTNVSIVTTIQSDVTTVGEVAECCSAICARTTTDKTSEVNTNSTL